MVPSRANWCSHWQWAPAAGSTRACRASRANRPKQAKVRSSEEARMKVFHGRTDGKPSELRTATFTGTVWGDPVMPASDGVMVGNVFFTPGARTHWHQHER